MPGKGVFRSLKHVADTVDGVALTRAGPVVSIATEGVLAKPASIVVHCPSTTAAVLVRVDYTQAGERQLPLHALVLSGQRKQSPLFPRVAGTSFAYKVTRVGLQEKSMGVDDAVAGWNVQVLAAVSASPCAARRWASVFPARPHSAMPQGCTAAEPKEFAGIFNQPAAFRAEGGRVMCCHCNTYHSCMARYVAQCAPDHPELA